MERSDVIGQFLTPDLIPTGRTYQKLKTYSNNIDHNVIRLYVSLNGSRIQSPE